MRAIATCTSQDFLQWTDPVHLEYGAESPNEHLYTNAVLPYHRAPHLFLGFPTRYIEGRGPHRGVTEGLFMSSRDGVHFRRWAEAFIPPGQNKDKWGNRSNYIWWGLEVNYATSAAGSLRVEIQDADGKAVPGHALDDCPEIYGDQVDGIVRWKGGADVSALAGQPVRLRFVMKDADLYSIRFTTGE